LRLCRLHEPDSPPIPLPPTAAQFFSEIGGIHEFRSRGLSFVDVQLPAMRAQPLPGNNPPSVPFLDSVLEMVREGRTFSPPPDLTTQSNPVAPRSHISNVGRPPQLRNVPFRADNFLSRVIPVEVVSNSFLFCSVFIYFFLR